jgi:hypothetical protein
MRKMNRRVMSAIGLAVAATATLGVAAGPAGATTGPVAVWLVGPHNVGIYNDSHVADGKAGPPDLLYSDRDGALAECYVTGDNLGNGDVWYKIDEGWYAAYGWVLGVDGFVYGGYIDGNTAFHNGLGHC